MKRRHLVLGLLALTITSSAAAQDEAARLKTIARLQGAGSAVGSLAICGGAGYEKREGGVEAYAQREVGVAGEDGMRERFAWPYMTVGMNGRMERDVATMNRIRGLYQAGDSAASTSTDAFIMEVAKRCDLLASMSDTAGLFSYAPPNADVAARLMREKLGFKPPITKPRVKK